MTENSQRGVMLRLYRQHRGNAELAVEAYAAAERRGQVHRRSNTHDVTAEAYARALYRDGIKKGWLKL